MSNGARINLKTNIPKLVELLANIPDKKDKIGWIVWLGDFAIIIKSLQNGLNFLSDMYGSKDNKSE